jgi:hypothetical protein
MNHVPQIRHAVLPAQHFGNLAAVNAAVMHEYLTVHLAEK